MGTLKDMLVHCSEPFGPVTALELNGKKYTIQEICKALGVEIKK